VQFRWRTPGIGPKFGKIRLKDNQILAGPCVASKIRPATSSSGGPGGVRDGAGQGRARRGGVGRGRPRLERGGGCKRAKEEDKSKGKKTDMWI
jgi:hypothetical protein